MLSIMRCTYECVSIVVLGIGLYIRWRSTEDVASAVLTLLGLVLLAWSCALEFTEDFEVFGRILSRFLASLLTAVVAFTDGWRLSYQRGGMLCVAVLTSVLYGLFWKLLDTCFITKPSKIKLLTVSDSMKLLGLVVASRVTGVDCVAVSLFALAYISNTLAVRLKSFQGFLLYLIFISAGVFWFFSLLGLEPNIFAFICFLDPHSFQSVVDLTVDMSSIERWRSFFRKSQAFHYLFVVILFCMELLLVIVLGHAAVKHTHREALSLLFSVSVFVWLLFLKTKFSILWKFMDKITQCSMVADEHCVFGHIMAAKGLRFFCLVTKRAMVVSFLPLLFLGLLGSLTANSYSLALTFLLLPVETAILSLFGEAEHSLGGTCTGYAVTAPVKCFSLPAQDGSIKTQATLARLRQLFRCYLVETFGFQNCKSPPVFNNLRNKLKAFFGHRTADGLRFDTYLLYFSGDVYDTGDWILCDDKRLSLKTLLSWWEEEDMDSGSRLLLLLDTASSFQWVGTAVFIKDFPLAIQTCRYASWPDMAESRVGSFTRAYVELNINCYQKGTQDTPPQADPSTGQEVALVDSFSWHKPIRALYGVSSLWSNSSFHRPEPGEVRRYLISLFDETLTRHLFEPLRNEVTDVRPGYVQVYTTHALQWLQWLRWLSMLVFTPQQVDTGNGLQLLKADNILALMSERFLYYDKLLQEFLFSPHEKDANKGET